MLKIRECTAADFGQIASPLRQLWPSKQRDLERLRAACGRAPAGPTQRYVCAEGDGAVVAFCLLSVRNSVRQEALPANIDELVVDERYRGRGIGRALVDHMIDLARQLGCTRIELESAFHRECARAFYERLGFEKRAFLFSKPL